MEKKEKRKTGGRKSSILFLLACFIFSMLCTVIGVIFIKGIKIPFLERNARIIVYLYSGIICLGFILSATFLFLRKQTAVKSFLLGYFFLFFFLLLAYILQRKGFFQIINDKEKFREYLENAGVWTPLIYILLQFLQVIILPIPGIVSTAVGVAIFGAFKTSLYSLIGIYLGSVAAFFIGRKWGSKAVVWIVGEENLKKWQKKLKGKDNLFLTLAFLLPLFPDDVLCFWAGLSSISTQYFLIMTFFTRLISILATCYSVNFIPFNTWWGITVWVILFAGVILLGLWVYKNTDKIQKFFQKRNRKTQK